MPHFSGMVQELLVEGLTVAAWVSLWTSFASLIFELSRIVSDIRIYRRIASREVVFRTTNLSKTLHIHEAKETDVNTAVHHKI
jgi:hypothetical protein